MVLAFRGSRPPTPHSAQRLGLDIVLVIGIVAISAQSATCQADWIKYEGNPVILKSDLEWDSVGIDAVSVLKEDGVYRMWYSAYNSTLSGIGMATSIDGARWEKHAENPLIVAGPEHYDADFIFGPTVVRDGPVYKMWYTGSADRRWTINLATSPDGVHWVKYGDNPVLEPGLEWYDGEGAGDPWVILDDGVYRMWYTCYNSSAKPVYAIAYATSYDGVAWTKHPQNPVLRAGDAGPDSDNVRGPCVVITGSTFGMWYRGIKDDWTICYATSFDGVDWQRYALNPVLWGEPGEWDARVWFPRVLVEKERYSMWYDSGDTGEVGYAYLPIGERLFMAPGLGAAVFCLLRLEAKRARTKMSCMS